MKTKDILNTGVNRNFLRKCIDTEIIAPARIDNEWIIDKDYIPYEYSQEDVETVWNTYLCRKIGLSYKQIKDLNNGHPIDMRNSISELIQKYEAQIEELQAIIEFMKYVKGIGFIPNPPNGLIGSDNFKNYITDFINYLDKDKKIKRVLDIATYASDIEDMQDETSEDFSQHLELMLDNANLGYNKEHGEAYSSALFKLSDKTHLNPSCDEVQNIIYEVFHHYKKLNNDETITAQDFAIYHIEMLSRVSDISVILKMYLGEKTFVFLIDALKAFRLIQKQKHH